MSAYSSNHCVRSLDITNYPTAEQTFLFNVWTVLEQIQDSIYDQSSPQYQLLEILNPLIFEIWVKSGRPGGLEMTRSKTRSTNKFINSYEKQFLEKYENDFFDRDIDADSTREMSRTFGIIETIVLIGNKGSEFFGIYIYQKSGKKYVRSGKIEHISPFPDGGL